MTGTRTAQVQLDEERREKLEVLKREFKVTNNNDAINDSIDVAYEKVTTKGLVSIKE